VHLHGSANNGIRQFVRRHVFSQIRIKTQIPRIIAEKFLRVNPRNLRFISFLVNEPPSHR
jgi:formyltetrahydrofolate synthetase